jgi:hypothetical protein
MQGLLDLRLASGRTIVGKPKDQYFAVLRHIIDLLAGEDNGLEDLRAVVAKRSGIPRADTGPSYEPDVDSASFEELSAETRELALEAALWLIGNWPTRFLWCCKEGGIHGTVLNRGAVSVPWFNEAVKSAYEHAS